MIDYSMNPAQTEGKWLMYFAADGSWGHADDIVIVDVSELDGHYTEVIDELNDWQLPDFMRWYVDNQKHDQLEDDSTCDVCEQWDSGMTEEEILADLDSEE